jgi:hypothetical protein
MSCKMDAKPYDDFLVWRSSLFLGSLDFNCLVLDYRALRRHITSILYNMLPQHDRRNFVRTA